MSSKMFRERGYLRLFAHYYRPHLALFLLDLICACLLYTSDAADEL